MGYLHSSDVVSRNPSISFSFPKGIVFDDLESSNLKFTLRLRQEVSPIGSWETRSRELRLVSTQEPRFDQKYSLLCGAVVL